MEKKVTIPNAIKQKVDDSAINALKAGKGTRVYGGGTSGISIGDEYVLKGVTFVEQYMKPDDVDDKAWESMSQAERAEQGTLRGWFAFTTNNGNLAFSTVLGDKRMNTEDFWKDEPAENKAEDFDLAKIWMPSCRTAEAFIEAECDKIIGKTIRCIAAKEEHVVTPTGREFDVRYRAWELLAK